MERPGAGGGVSCNATGSWVTTGNNRRAFRNHNDWGDCQQLCDAQAGCTGVTIEASTSNSFSSWYYYCKLHTAPITSVVGGNGAENMNCVVPQASFAGQPSDFVRVAAGYCRRSNSSPRDDPSPDDDVDEIVDGDGVEDYLPCTDTGSDPDPLCYVGSGSSSFITVPSPGVCAHLCRTNAGNFVCLGYEVQTVGDEFQCELKVYLPMTTELNTASECWAMRTEAPTAVPTTANPTTAAPTVAPSRAPTRVPTRAPTRVPSNTPTTAEPSAAPSTHAPSLAPTTHTPSTAPSTPAPTTSMPTLAAVAGPQTPRPTAAPVTPPPSQAPSRQPTSSAPTAALSQPPSTTPPPSQAPSRDPTSSAPTADPTQAPSAHPTQAPTDAPTKLPSAQPTATGTGSPACTDGCGGDQVGNAATSADDSGLHVGAVIAIVAMLLVVAAVGAVYAKHVTLRGKAAHQNGAGNHLVIFSPPVHMDAARPAAAAAATARRGSKNLTGREPDRRDSYMMQNMRAAPAVPARVTHRGTANPQYTVADAAEAFDGFGHQPLYLAPVAGDTYEIPAPGDDTYEIPVPGDARRGVYAAPAALDDDDDDDDDEGTFGGFGGFDGVGTMTSMASGHAAEQFDAFGFNDYSPSATPSRQGSFKSGISLFESAEYETMGFGGDVYAEPADCMEGSDNDGIYASPSGDFADPEGWANVNAWVALGGGGPGRQEAEDILGNGSLPLGSYLLRSPQPNGGVTLSVKRYATQVLHYRIVKDSDGMFRLQDTGPDIGQFFADVNAVLRASTFEEGDPRADRAAVHLTGCIDISRWIDGVGATSTL